MSGTWSVDNPATVQLPTSPGSLIRVPRIALTRAVGSSAVNFSGRDTTEQVSNEVSAHVEPSEMMLKTAVFALTLAPSMAMAGDNLPSGWIKAGSQPAEYEVGVDSSIRHGGRASGYVKAITKDLHGFGTLMQTTGPGQYLGKRVRLSAFVKAEMVSDWAGLWLRVDGPLEGNQPKLLAFDNMQGRPIKGTIDWTRVEIVLDVASDARDIAFGILLSRDGQVWLDDLKFEVVPTSVPVTGRGSQMTNAPSNLDFER
jgi:hypothetical protein